MKHVLIVILFLCVSFSAFSQQLGERIDLSGSKATKGLKFSICPPIGWEMREGKNPNVSKQFVETSTGNSFNITITYGGTFISKKEFAQFEDFYINEYKKQLDSQFDQIIEFKSELIRIDDYPFLQFTTYGYMKKEFLNVKTTCRLVVFMGCVEDLVLTLTGFETGCTQTDQRLPNLFKRIASSISLYEQYEYIRP